MSEPINRRVNLARVVGSPYCVSIEDGAKVHDVILKSMESGERVILTFDGVERLTTAFLNSAVGQLYDGNHEDEVRRFLLPPEGASQEQLRLLVRVVENAKRFFAAPDRHRTIIGNVLRDE